MGMDLMAKIKRILKIIVQNRCYPKIQPNEPAIPHLYYVTFTSL